MRGLLNSESDSIKLGASKAILDKMPVAVEPESDGALIIPEYERMIDFLDATAENMDNAIGNLMVQIGLVDSLTTYQNWSLCEKRFNQMLCSILAGESDQDILIEFHNEYAIASPEDRAWLDCADLLIEQL